MGNVLPANLESRFSLSSKSKATLATQSVSNFDRE